MKKEEVNTKPDESIEDLQAELLRLQRQFRLLEDDRRVYKEETEYSLRKQRETIRNLNIEYEELAKEDKLASSTKNQNTDADNTKVLTQLLKEQDEVNRALYEQNEHMNAVNTNIKELLETLDKQRKGMGGCKESERRCKAMIKLIGVMENRLNAANIKFSSALAENSEMRHEIDHISIQRKRFEDLHKKLTKIFQIGKNKKDDLIENATSLFNSRDEAHHRMQCLRERSERDMTTFNTELKDLLRVIDHDRKLREFMNTKMEERNELYEAAVKGRKEKKLMDHIKVLQNEVEHYESIFKELKEVTGIDDTDEMVMTFINVEDENFAMFNFVKNQNQALQQQEASIKTLQQQITNVGQEEVVIAKEHKIILKQLQETEARQITDNQSVGPQLKTDQKILENIRLSFDKTLDRVQSNRSDMADLLCGSNITNENLISYIGLFEQRACELLQTKSLLLQKSNEGVTPITFATFGRIAKCLVAPPAFFSAETAEASGQTPSSNELVVRPMSQKEIRMAATLVTKLKS